jgi:pSer/pThr/pTyr-binding forkhead associated (FHA) protein
MPKLIVRHPEMGDMTYPLSGDRVTVGRRADNVIQINHGTISGHHAELVAVNGHYLLRDLDSTNHCFVDGFQVTEADLSDRCKVMIGTIECEFIPDAPLAVTEIDVLRKTIGHLREQNDDLIAKLNDQQKQIDILGSARLLTPATGADLTALRAEVKNLSAERERLLKENQGLRAEVERLRVIAARSGEATSLKATVPINLAAAGDGTVSIGPGGTTTLAAPMAKVIAPDPVVEVAPQLVEFTARAKTLVAELRNEATREKARTELAAVTERMAERAAVIPAHPVTRLISGFDALARDIAHRTEPIEASVLQTLSETVQLLDRVLAPELLHQAKVLPVPRILALSDDEYLLPGMVAALEFARFEATSCTTGEKALSTLRENAFDLMLMGTPLPGSTLEDARAPIRSLPKGDRLPIIALTPEGMSRPNGVNAALTQPVNLFELTLKANVWVLKHQLELM